MDNRGTGLIALLGATLLCGFPGLVSLCCGATLMLAGPSPETDYSGDLTPEMVSIFGVAGLCIGLFFILIPMVVGYFALRRKPDLPVVSWDEPIPPAI
jgi:hypothetical protein